MHLANSLQAKLSVEHVKDDRLAHWGDVDQLMTEVTKDQFVNYVKDNNDTATQLIVDDFARKADRLGVEHSVTVESGIPEQKIVELAKESVTDLLAIGSGARSAKRFGLSSGIAGKITRKNPCPVLTAI